MLRHELTIEQLKAADPQPRNQPDQCRFRRIGRARKHALAEKRAAQCKTIKPADQLRSVCAGQPAFDTMRPPCSVQRDKGLFNVAVDPCFFAVGRRFCAQLDDALKGCVGGDRETILPHRFGQRARDIQPIERHNRAHFWFDPKYVGVIARIGHRKNSGRIGTQQQIGINGHRR